MSFRFKEATDYIWAVVGIWIIVFLFAWGLYTILSGIYKIITVTTVPLE